ncbi:MAG: helix-turn-helix transcriptional regulator [Clostridia bacterium]|nr:helix-turn-helix transcriptional regulator [Clostridia bacterium]
MAARRKTASRGFVNNIILESLISGDKYGYEIIKEVEEKSNGKIQLKQPSLYSSLKRFETKGFITSYWGDSDIGGRRHYYTITELGKNHYNKTINKGYDVDDEEEDEITVEQIEQLEIASEPKISEKQEQTTTLTKNTDDEDYNIFELLENKQSPKPVSTKKETTAKPETIKENSIQVDMFSSTAPQNEVYKEETVNVNRIQQLKLNDETPAETQQTVNEEKHDIPLIKEQSQDFFSWEDLKRKQVALNKEELNEQKSEPIKNQVVMDEYGILKVGEPAPTRKEQKIFDNVGARIDYKDPVIKQTPKAEKVDYSADELTEEERELRNKKFNEKFNEIISQKTNTTEPAEPEIDYKNILGDLLATDNESEITENNNYDYDYEEEIPAEQIEEAIVQTQNYNYNIQPKKNFEPEGFKFKPFVTEVDEDKKETNFILVNKARFKYGIFMFVLMILQISTLLIALKSQNLLYSTDYIFYGIGYGIAVALLLICLIPYFVSPDKRKSNTFKLSYSLLFGILLFLATCALTYALCTFAGLNNSNVTLFSTKLLLPIILAINFILTPLVYKMVLLDKKVY